LYYLVSWVRAEKSFAIGGSEEHLPSENPKTGRITALSVLGVLRKLNGDFWVGS